MKRSLTLRSKTMPVIMALLFLGTSLLFSSCSEHGEPFTLCDKCKVAVEAPGEYVFQYIDCNGNIQSTKLSFLTEVQTILGTNVDNCERWIKLSKVQ